MTAYLDAWSADSSQSATRHVVWLLEENLPDLFKRGVLANAFWKGRQPQMQQVIDWIVSAEIGDRLTDAFFAVESEPVRTELSLAVQQWEQTTLYFHSIRSRSPPQRKD